MEATTHPRETVKGMRVVSNREFEVEMTEPIVRFLYVLAMFQTSVVPREAVVSRANDGKNR